MGVRWCCIKNIFLFFLADVNDVLSIGLSGCFNELCQEVQMDLDHSDKRAVGNSVE